MPAFAFGWQQLSEYFRHKRALQSVETEAKAGQNARDLVQDQDLARR